jgi:hypothetical protein
MVKTNAMTRSASASTRTPHRMYLRLLVSLMEGYRTMPIRVPIAQPCEPDQHSSPKRTLNYRLQDAPGRLQRWDWQLSAGLVLRLAD